MKLKFLLKRGCLAFGMALITQSNFLKAQITLLKDYSNKTSPRIGIHQGVTFRESGFSGMTSIPNTNGREFWIVSDRGVNIDCDVANPSTCRPTYNKMYPFPAYAPKIHRVRVTGDSVQILQTIAIKNPSGATVTGIINPTGFGSTALEQASTDTVQNCANFSKKIAVKDIWGIDSEGILVDAEGNFWICEEGGPTIWKVASNGVVIRRYSPYAGISGSQPQDFSIDTCFKYRKNNRGFESITQTPNGRIYAIIQSPLLYPNATIGEGTRVHRMIELNPVTNEYRMFAYLNDGIIGASGSNQIRLRDWKIGDMAAINDTSFLVIEAAARGTSDVRRIYRISINGATVVNSGFGYGGKTLEGLVDSAGLASNGVVPVRKRLFMDLLANAWPAVYDKAEGLTIINDSTIALCNDNDYGQFSPNLDGVITPTTTTGHILVYGLKGANKLTGYKSAIISDMQGITGPSTAQSPYLNSTYNGVRFTSILSAGEAVNGYKLAGIPDGTGAFDNGNGTFTLLVNHELSNTLGVSRAHGSIGAFVSKWIINKSDLSVISGEDLIKNVNLYSAGSYTNFSATNPSSRAAFNRFCSADLPQTSAFFNVESGLGTTERIYMNGEESGPEGRVFAHIVSGLNAGTTWELPLMGKYSCENALANPFPQNKTIVVNTDDASPGQVYVYVGTKSLVGTEVDKAGLTNGKLYGVAVSGLTLESSSSLPTAGTAFGLIDMGNIKDSTGTSLNNQSNLKGVTNFLRPEDGTWDPYNPTDFYFVTTNAITAPSRLWRLRFSDITNPEKGGTITCLLNGTEGQKMLDNLTIDNSGNIMMQEDVGGNIHNGKIWQYSTKTGQLIQIAQHDPNRFITGGSNFMTIDEESSGLIDAEEILGPGMFLLVDQAHYSIPGEIVEGGQILAMYNQMTDNTNPEISLNGNNIEIINNDTLPSSSDFTAFGAVSTSNPLTRTFVIRNTGKGNLDISNIRFIGLGSTDFSLVSAPAFPFTIAAGNSYAITVRFAPATEGLKKALLVINNNDFNEYRYSIGISGTGFLPGQTGPSSTQSPYLVGLGGNATFTSILTANDVVNGYRMAGTPDGAGVYDNEDGTFTMLVNHEFLNTAGVPRAHGSTGAFISKWTINKSNLSVVKGEDLTKTVKLWDGKAYYTSNAANPSAKGAFSRFCSADLPDLSAFYNNKNANGTTEKIFMNGEETGPEGRAFAHILTGSETGTAYELPYLGKFSWENSLARPYSSDKTVVIGTDDATPGQVYMYVGTKQKTGNVIEKAGLTNGKLYGVAMNGVALESNGTVLYNNGSVPFKMIDLGVVRDSSGNGLNNLSNKLGVTNFLRPEDGTWDPQNPSDFYFVTTNNSTSPSRLWRLRFDDIENPENGGQISMLLDGTEGQKMMDNMCIDNTGNLLLQEDVGSNNHNGKIWNYNAATDKMTLIAQHDASRFEVGGANFLTIDEESSGIIDAQKILGPGMFLLVDQAHYSIAGEVVEGGQILSMFNKATFDNLPEIDITGNNLRINDGSVNISASNNTDFGMVEIGTTANENYAVRNTGKGSLLIKSISIDGANAADFNIENAPKTPMYLPKDSTLNLLVKFKSGAVTKYAATLRVITNDLDEENYDFAIGAQGIQADMVISGNGKAIANNDMSAGSDNGTDMGNVEVRTQKKQVFVISNNGLADLKIGSINLSGSGASDFVVTKIPSKSTLSAGESVNFEITYSATKNGQSNAMITIAGNNVVKKDFTFAIKATGISSEIEVTGNNLPIANGDYKTVLYNNTDFDGVKIGDPIVRNFVIKNSGMTNLVIDGLTANGIGDFTITDLTSFPVTVASGGYRNFGVRFNPASEGLSKATIAIKNNDLDESTFEFVVSGMGTKNYGLNSSNVKNGNYLEVYPNPSSDYIQFSQILNSAVLYDASGKLVLSANNTERLDISRIPAGIYVLRANGRLNVKVTVVK